MADEQEDKITVRRAGSVVVIAPHGEIRRERTDQLTEAISLALDEEIQHVILTFRYVSVLLSDGIRLLVALRDRVANEGKSFYITDLPKRVHYTIRITNLLDFFNHHKELKPLLATLDAEQHHDAVVPPPEPKPQPADTPIKVSTEELRLGKLPAAPVDADAFAGQEDEAPLPSLVLDETEDETTPDAPQEDAVKSTEDAAIDIMKETENSVSTPQTAAMADDTEEDEEDEDGEAEVREIIERYLPDRLAIELVDYFIRKDISVASVEQLADGLDKPFDDVYDKASELVSRLVLKSLGAELLNYSPDLDLNDALRWFMKLWHSRQYHGYLLSMVIANEEKHAK